MTRQETHEGPGSDPWPFCFPYSYLVRERLLAWLEDLNRKDPPDYNPPWVLANIRHPCPGHRQSTPERMVQASIYLSERYETPRSLWGEDDDSMVLIFKEGRCPKCQATVRSDGWVTDRSERPPIEGRVARH